MHLASPCIIVSSVPCDCSIDFVVFVGIDKLTKGLVVGLSGLLAVLYTSNLAEATVNTLINDRQKGKKKMLWSRDGAHNILQVRSSVFSNRWNDDWKKIESIIYLKAA